MVGLAYVIAVGGVVYDATTALLQLFSIIDANVAGIALYIPYFFYEGGPLLLPLVAVALAIAESHERVFRGPRVPSPFSTSRS